MTALEALAMARPVVATCVGGLPEIIREGKTGLLVPPNDPPALAKAIKRLVDSPRLRATLASNGRDLAAAEFSLSIITRRLREEYHALLHAP